MGVHLNAHFVSHDLALIKPVIGSFSFKGGVVWSSSLRVSVLWVCSEEVEGVGVVEAAADGVDAGPDDDDRDRATVAKRPVLSN